MVMHEEEEEEEEEYIQELLWLELTVGSSLSSPMCCGCENGSLVGVNHASNELSTLKKRAQFQSKVIKQGLQKKKKGAATTPSHSEQVS
jgi:hypothetical protein